MNGETNDAQKNVAKPETQTTLKLTGKGRCIESLQAVRDQGRYAGIVHIVLWSVSRQGMVEREGLSGLGGCGRGRTSSFSAALQ